MVKNIFEDSFASLIVEEILIHGYLEMSSVLMKVLSISFHGKSSDLTDSDIQSINENFRLIKESFEKLVKDGILEKLPVLEIEQNIKETYKNVTMHKVPKFVVLNESNKQDLPELKIEDSRKFKAIKEDYETPTFRIKRENENFGDSFIYWKVNQKKFFQIFRDLVIVQAIETRIDKNAAKIVKTVLRLVDTKNIPDKAEKSMHLSKPTTAIDIQKMMKLDHKMDSITVDKYINAIVQDSFRVLEKIGDFSGGAFCVDYRKSLHHLCLAHIESYVKEKYDSKSLRIFKVILEKSQLEQKQIEDFSMIPSKDCKALLYNMLNDGLLFLTELSKTSDHAPPRTFYLFNIDVYQVCRKLLQNSYKVCIKF